MNRISFWVSLFCWIYLSGCAESQTGPIGQNIDMEALLEKRDGKLLPDACSIVPTEEIAEILGLNSNQIIVRNSTPRDANPTHSSCFFKWDDPSYPNSGILIQAIRNPNEIEYPDYVVQWIESTKTMGEQGIEGSPIYFEDFQGYGDDGSYSLEAGKFYWRLGSKIYFVLAFNTPFHPEAQFEMAEKLAYKVTKNYISG